MIGKKYKIPLTLLAAFLTLNANAISTEGAELRTTFIAPIDHLDGPATWGEMAGVSVRLNISKLPTAGAVGRIYDWGLSLSTSGLRTSTDGKDMNCQAMRIQAAFRTNGLGQRKLVVYGSNSRDHCEGTSVVHDFEWRDNQTYELSAKRDSYVTDRTSSWTISVKNLDDRTQNFSTNVFAKNNLENSSVLTHLRDSECGDSDWLVNWSHPEGVIDDARYRLGRLEFGLGEGACGGSTQDLKQTCGLQWTHQMGGNASRPRGDYYPGDSVKEAMTCRSIGDGTGMQVATAYVNAIAYGGSTNVGITGLDFSQRKCGMTTVWGDECQKMVFNGQGGKIYMMNAITSVSANESWEKSNIKEVIPPTLMSRIVKDPEFSQAKDMLGYIRDPNNNWFPWLAGKGQPKDILLQYMESIK